MSDDDRGDLEHAVDRRGRACRRTCSCPKGAQNTPRVLITNKDQTRTGFCAGRLQPRVQRRRLAPPEGRRSASATRRTRSSRRIPGGYVLLNWGTSFLSNSGEVGTGTYGYYEVNDRGTRGTVDANMPSLFVQDTWTVGNRLTLNLGVRTERETIPSFRTDIKDDAFEFGFGKKIAPRLGATYDVLGDGRLKAFGSWGRYFDWVKYELARGSFGGDTWLVNYRSLDTLDVYNLSLVEHAGRGPVGRRPRPPRAQLRHHRSRPEADVPGRDQPRHGVSARPDDGAFGVNYVHNKLTGPSRTSARSTPPATRSTSPRTRARAWRRRCSSTGLTAPFSTPRPMRQYDALEVTLSRRFSNNWFGSANVTISRLYGNYAGLANSDEITTPTTGTSSSTAQQQAGSIARPGTAAGRAWDLDELEWIRTGPSTSFGRLATDRPVVAKFYGAYTSAFGTQVGGVRLRRQRHAGEHHCQHHQHDPGVRERPWRHGPHADAVADRPAGSHEFDMMRHRKIRFELNVINLFNQKTATHIFNALNKGAGLARARPGDRPSGTDLSKGYDYNALILASPSGVKAFDPRYGQADLWQAGTQGQFSIRYLF